MTRDRDARDRFRRLERLFEELVGLAPPEREARLLGVAGEDAELAAELRELLRADDTGELDRAVRDAVGGAAVQLARPAMEGVLLGPWRILEPIGEGGMGTVYAAERADGAYEARAAVKLVRGGLPSPVLERKLRAERQILANLTHPGIARLLDGGSTRDGTPFLVMEFVDGVAVTTWCDREGVGVEGRLRMILKICDAVSYAHRALVVHRDIKPGNILVTPQGEPKLLDFGIATLVDRLEDGEGGEARATQGWRMLTPGYASPEQLQGAPVGVAADVYAVGVLLYRLLTGRLPVEVDGMPPGEASRAVTEKIPPRASTVVDDLPRARRLKGDLDAIVARALRKEPGQRYPSVEALAEDLRRHLEGRPISVRRDEWRYRTGKFVRRNAGAVSAGALVTLLLVSFTVSSLLQARSLARERDRVERERVTAERVTEFLAELFTEADPNESPLGDVTARQVLDRGADRLFESVEDEPEVQAALAMVMGRVYRGLGEYGVAEPLLDSALALRQRTTPSPSQLAEAFLERGALAYDNGGYEEALSLQQEALGLLREDEETAMLRAELLDWSAVTLAALGRMEEAEDYSRRYLAATRELYEEPSGEIATAMINVADVLRDRGALEEAEELNREGLRMRRELFGDMDLSVAHALNQYASTLINDGRPEEAAPLVEESLAIRREVFSGPHAETAASLGNYSRILASLGRDDEALDARRESLAMLREIFPDEHPYIAGTTFSLGDYLYWLERYDEAVEQLTLSVRLHRVTLPEAHPNLGFPLTALGRTYLAMDRPGDAEAVLREAYTIRKEGLGPDHWHVAASGLELGRAEDRLGLTEDAEDHFRESLDLLEATFGADNSRTGQAREALAAHYRSRGMEEEAQRVEAGAGTEGEGEGGAAQE